MLAIPHHSQVFSMAMIDIEKSHEDPRNFHNKNIVVENLHNKHTLFCLYKETQKKEVQEKKTSAIKEPFCMRTRSKARRLQQQQQVPLNLVETPKDTMADNRTMAELLHAPTEGYEDAIVVPEI
ncbi:hypothetical protein Tco_0281054 [Tanacetum coccineum]